MEVILPTADAVPPPGYPLWLRKIAIPVLRPLLFTLIILCGVAMAIVIVSSWYQSLLGMVLAVWPRGMVALRVIMIVLCLIPVCLYTYAATTGSSLLKTIIAAILTAALVFFLITHHESDFVFNMTMQAISTK